MKISFLFMIFVLLTRAYAQDIPKEQLETKAVMNQVYESFLKIIPFIYSDKLTFETEKQENEAELIKNLTEIKKAFASAGHVSFLKSPGFKPSLETINIHIQETIDSLLSKNKVFAHARLKAMTVLCISCHSQLSNAVSKNAFNSFASNISRNQFDTDFAYANYLFLVRRFPESVYYFELSIKSFLSKTSHGPSGLTAHEKTFNLEFNTSLRRILTIYTQITFEPAKAITFLKKYNTNKSLSKITRTDIDSWIKALETWKKFDINKITSTNDFINKYLSVLDSSEAARVKINTGENDITLLISSGVLSKFLNDNPQSQATPQILYWLSIAERRLSTTYFFTLGDIYLKECMAQFPSSPFAKKCYQEYEENILFGYSGSGGTEIPIDVKRELQRLKNLIK